MKTWTIMRIAERDDIPNSSGGDMFGTIECPAWAIEYRERGDGGLVEDSLYGQAFLAGWSADSSVSQFQVRELLS